MIEAMGEMLKAKAAPAAKERLVCTPASTEAVNSADIDEGGDIKGNKATTPVDRALLIGGE